jgi:hypothetical protein
MDVEEVVEYTGAPKLLWYLLTNQTVTAIDPGRRPERYREAVWLKATWIYKRMLDQMDVQEEVLHASVTGQAESVRKVMQAHQHMPWALAEAAERLVGQGNVDVVMAFIGWIQETDVKVTQTVMVQRSVTTVVARWCQAGMVMRRREGIDELRMLIVGERCFRNLMANDDHGGWGFDGLESRENTQRLGAAVHNLVWRYPIMFWHGALFALVSGNAKASHVNMLTEAIATPKDSVNVGNVGVTSGRGIVPRIAWDPVNCGAGAHGRTKHSHLVGSIFSANDEFLDRCRRALRRLPTEPILP